MIGAFLIKLAQIDKTGSVGQFFIPLGNLKIKDTFSIQQIDHVFCDFCTLTVR